MERFGLQIGVWIFWGVVLLIVWRYEGQIRNWWHERQAQKQFEEEQIKLREEKAQAEQEAREAQRREEQARRDAAARAEREAREQQLHEARALREAEEKAREEQRKLEEEQRQEKDLILEEERKQKEIAERKKQSEIQLYQKQLNSTQDYVRWILATVRRSESSRPNSPLIRMEDLPPVFKKQLFIIDKQDQRLDRTIQKLIKVREVSRRVPQRKASSFGLGNSFELGSSFRLGRPSEMDVRYEYRNVEKEQAECLSLRQKALKEVKK